MQNPSSQIVESLASKYRVLILGGLAVIAHGLSRTTEDADIWLEPLESATRWCQALRTAVQPYDKAYFFDVSQHGKIVPDSLEEVITTVGMIRVGGLDRYLDVFYLPNQLELEDFEFAWDMAALGLGKSRVMDESFLIATKTDTGRPSDQNDVSFLENKLRQEISAQLQTCSLAEAERHFSRYLDHSTCLAALENPEVTVQKMGLDGLRQLAGGGNPFAMDALKNALKIH